MLHVSVSVGDWAVCSMGAIGSVILIPLKCINSMILII